MNSEANTGRPVFWCGNPTTYYAHTQLDAHVDAFRNWEREWYGPHGPGPASLGYGFCPDEEIEGFYNRCLSHARKVGDKDLAGRFLATIVDIRHGDFSVKPVVPLPAVNGGFVLTALQPHQE